MMRFFTITFAVISVVAQTAQAGHFDCGRDVLGLGGHHGEVVDKDFDEAVAAPAIATAG